MEYLLVVEVEALPVVDVRIDHNLRHYWPVLVRFVVVPCLLVDRLGSIEVHPVDHPLLILEQVVHFQVLVGLDEVEYGVVSFVLRFHRLPAGGRKSGAEKR